MKYGKKFGVLVVALAVSLGASLADVAKPADKAKAAKALSEAEVLKLIELQIDDDAIIARLDRGGIGALKVDEVLLGRLKKAGASEDVQAALRRLGGEKTVTELPEDPAKASIMVWVKPYYDATSPLVSDLRVNGQLINSFTSQTQQSIGKHVKMGWNTVTLKTTRQDGVKDNNSLHFSIGTTEKKGDELKMTRTLWAFDNYTDWSYDSTNEMLKHRSGPKVKEITLTFRLYFAGMKYEAPKAKEGDYILKHSQYYNVNPAVTTTLVVNGTTLTTWLGQSGREEIVVTSLLKKGKNEVRVMTKGPTGALALNANDFEINGPAEWNAKEDRLLFKPVLQVKGLTGWVQDKKTARWSIDGKPAADTLERVVTFHLDEAPKAK